MPTATKKSTPAKPAAADENGESKAKRKSYTPEEKIAKLEADLAAVRQKQADKNAKQIDSLQEKLDKAVEKRDKANLEVSEIERELDLLKSTEAFARVGDEAADETASASEED